MNKFCLSNMLGISMLTINNDLIIKVIVVETLLTIKSCENNEKSITLFPLTQRCFIIRNFYLSTDL